MKRGVAGVLALGALVAGTPAAHAAVEVQAHRGGSFVSGAPLYPENTLPAFEAAAAAGYTIELDVSRALDGMIVIHDPTLERTTVCTGKVRMHTLAMLRGCPSDVLGSPGSSLGGVQVPGQRVALPRVEEVLALAKRTGAKLSIEIKNVPTESDFDATMRVAFGLVKAIKASGVAASQLVVQSFWPPNLDVVELLAPKIETALLTLTALNDAAPLYAKARGYEWVSPGWPVKEQTVDLAHALGLRVVPYTLNSESVVQEAAGIGVDAVISDDPAMAAEALGG